MIGQTISHYKILEKLGEGGMGVVYKAKDTKLDRFVALKFLPSHLSASEQDKARFIQEAKAASALNHPNVATVYEIDEADGQMFIAMEFVDGTTLREKKQEYSVKQVIEIGIQIADGLSVAHEKGIIHRDIKPENIMIRKDGIVQIMDFGLAKLRDLKGTSRLTKEGSTIGTMGYMSPEQVQGQDTDHRTDIFSMGVLLYELLAGQLPFNGVHETAIMYEIVNVDAAPISSARQDIDPNLDAIILECLAKEPDERFQSAKEVSKELKRFKRESSRQKVSRVTTVRQTYTHAGPEMIIASDKPNWKKYLWPMLTGILSVGIVLLAVSLWKASQTPHQQVMRFSVTLPESETLDFSAIGSTLTISPDGQYLVYNSTLNGTSQLFLRPMDQLRATPIPGTEFALDPFFSPDGQWVAFYSQGKIKRVPIYGGAPQDICDTKGPIRGGWWAKNGFIYYGHISKSIYRVAEASGTPVPVTKLDSTNDEISHRYPCVLPDGKSILFTVKPNNISTFDDALIAVQRLDTGERKILLKGGTFPRYVSTGHIVYARGKSIFAVPFDPDKLEITGPAVHLLDGGMTFVGSGASSFGFSENGTFVYVPGGPLLFNNISLVSSDRRGNLKPLMDKTSAYSNAKLSPDGDKLALDISAANDDIWVYTISRGTLTRLTFGGGNNNNPIWTPDGKYVVYQAEKGGAPNLYRKQWNGSGSEERLTVNANGQLATSWSADGKILTFNQSGDIWVLPVDQEKKPWVFLNSPFDEYDATFSLDGKWVAYGSNESGRGEIYIVPFPNREGKWQISTEGGYQPMWANGELFYLNGKKVMKVDVHTQPTFTASVPQKMFELPKQVIGVSDVSRNGQQFILTTVESQELTTSQVLLVLGWFEDLKNKFTTHQ